MVDTLELANFVFVIDCYKVVLNREIFCIGIVKSPLSQVVLYS